MFVQGRNLQAFQSEIGEILINRVQFMELADSVATSQSSAAFPESMMPEFQWESDTFTGLYDQ